MHRNGETPYSAGGTGCSESNVGIANGIFPVEYTASNETADPCFTGVFDRRYAFLPWAEDHARASGGGLSIGALQQFLAAAGINWWIPLVEPTRDHLACHQEYLFVANAWAFPVHGQLQARVAAAIAARVEGQARWPAPPQVRAAADNGRPAMRRWPQPRPHPWEGPG